MSTKVIDVVARKGPPILGTILRMPFGRVVTLFAEIIAIGSAVGAVLSILLNNFRFNHWGLSFTDVANASDIIMSGVTVGIDLSKLIIFITVGALISEEALILISKITINRKVILIAPVVVVLIIATLTIVYSLRIYMKYYDGNENIIGKLDLIFLGLATGAFLGPIFFSRFRITSRFSVILVVLLTTVAASALISVKDLDNNADHAEFRWLSADNFCIGAPTVVWIGSSALVAKCATSDHTWTYIIRDRGQGIIGHRRAVVRFVRSQRPTLYRPLYANRSHQWELAANLKAPIYIDRGSIKLEGGEAQFIAAYFPIGDPNRPDILAGTSVQISDQLIKCVFPYSGRLVDLMAISGSGRRIRLDETTEDKRYDRTIANYDYELAQFVCENIGVRQAIDPTKLKIIKDLFQP